MTGKNTGDEYELIDSGGGEKLERFGSRLIARPSSLCIWNKAGLKENWNKADARFEPGRGWVFKKETFESWEICVCGCLIELRLQSNGQVGLFPEHASYMKELAGKFATFKEIGGNSPQCLNLFAYTGLASVFCAQQGMRVTHVDLSKRALEWTKRNCSLNHVAESQIRFILEDAISFLAKEGKRQKKYEVVIADPPSFSRVSKSKHWKLSESLPALVKACFEVLNPERHVFVLTCHEPELSAEMLANVAIDWGGSKEQVEIKREMSLIEGGGTRRMPAGSLVVSFK